MLVLLWQVDSATAAFLTLFGQCHRHERKHFLLITLHEHVIGCVLFEFDPLEVQPFYFFDL